jgi:membrane protease YdiL (CAAX protease family)
MQEPNTLLSGTPPRKVNLLPFGGGAALLLLLFALGNAVGGELGALMAASINALPFAVLAVLAYLGADHPNWARIAAPLWLLLMIGGASLIALLMSIAALAGGLIDEQIFARLTRDDWLRVALVFLGVGASVIGGVMLAIPPVRLALVRARLVPIDPTSFVHTIALVAVVTLGLVCTVPLLVLGAPPLLAVVEQVAGGTAGAGRGELGQLLDLVYGLVWTIPATILAVGFGIKRSLRESLERLGLVRPGWRQAAAAVLIALLLVGAVQLIGLATDWLWRLLGWTATDDAAFGELIGFAINPVGAVVIGVTAGLGEELAVRGVLQPRLGLLLSNLFFTSLHAFQYSWDALLVVFVVGVACGLVRRRTNTSTAAIVHGVYNFTLVMLAAAGIGS